MPLIYLSQSKLASLEDTLLFFPTLFKLTKSIVVTEPLTLQKGPDITDDIKIEEEKTTENKENEENDHTIGEEFYRIRGTMKIKTSRKLKKMIQ